MDPFAGRLIGRRGAFLAATIAITATMTWGATTLASGQWTLTSPMNSAHGQTPLTVLNDGHVFAVSGVNATVTGWSQVTEFYEPSTDTWIRSGDVHVGRDQFNPVTLNTGKVLIAGGWSGYVDGTAELWDPATGVWSYTGGLNTPRRAAPMIKLPDGRVLIVSGAVTGGGDGTTTSEIYDPATGQWSYTGSVGTPRTTDGPAVTVLDDGRVMLIGPIPDSVSNTVELYDPATGTWSYTGSLHDSINAGGLVKLADGRVLAMTCCNLAVGLMGAEIYDPQTGAWSRAATPPYPESNAILLPSGRVVAAGGANPSEIYDPISGAWSVDATPLAVQNAAKLALLSSGRVLMVGGYPAGGYPVPTAEILTVGPPVATTKDQCKNGGWQTHARGNGTSFRNQGDCIQYVSTGR